MVREVLKKQKRLTPRAQAANLPHVQSVLEEYLPFVVTLETGLKRTDGGGESPPDGGPRESPTDELANSVVIQRSGEEEEIEVEWRPTLTGRASIPGRERSRVKDDGIGYELGMVLLTIAYTYTSLAREMISGETTTTTTTAIQTATKHLLRAASIHEAVADRCRRRRDSAPMMELTTAVQSALASIALAEATLLAVLKDDPYAAAVTKESDPNNREWMMRAPNLPRVRAHLLARLCMAAAESLDQAMASLTTTGMIIFIPDRKKKKKKKKRKMDKIDGRLLEYVGGRRRCARAMTCRFLAIDAELRDQPGSAIGWLQTARIELGANGNDDPSNSNLINRGNETNAVGKGPISGWKHRRHLTPSFLSSSSSSSSSSSIERHSDGGRGMELIIIQSLMIKWEKINDTVRPITLSFMKSRLFSLSFPLSLSLSEAELIKKEIRRLDPSSIYSSTNHPSPHSPLWSKSLYHPDVCFADLTRRRLGWDDISTWKSP